MNVTVELDIAEYYLSKRWSWHFREVAGPDGRHFEATIEEIPDFFAAAETVHELAVDAREALLSHIRSYLATGKDVPVSRIGSPRTPTAGVRLSSMGYAVAGSGR